MLLCAVLTRMASVCTSSPLYCPQLKSSFDESCRATRQAAGRQAGHPSVSRDMHACCAARGDWSMGAVASPVQHRPPDTHTHTHGGTATGPHQTSLRGGYQPAPQRSQQHSRRDTSSSRLTSASPPTSRCPSSLKALSMSPVSTAAMRSDSFVLSDTLNIATRPSVGNAAWRAARHTTGEPSGARAQGPPDAVCVVGYILLTLTAPHQSQSPLASGFPRPQCRMLLSPVTSLTCRNCRTCFLWHNSYVHKPSWRYRHRPASRAKQAHRVVGGRQAQWQQGREQQVPAHGVSSCYSGTVRGQRHTQTTAAGSKKVRTAATPHRFKRARQVTRHEGAVCWLSPGVTT